MSSEPTILDAARRLVRRNGAITVDQLGHAIADDGVPEADEDELRDRLLASPQVRWLDEEHIWLWTGRRGGNRVLHAIEKILSVARSIEVETLCDGVRRVRALHDWWMPHEVVTSLCVDADLCEPNGNGRLSAGSGVREWRVLLGRYELTLVKILANHGPSLARDELKHHATRGAGLNVNALSACLRHSPILEPHGSRHFRLRGGPASVPGADGEPESNGDGTQAAAASPSPTRPASRRRRPTGVRPARLRVRHGPARGRRIFPRERQGPSPEVLPRGRHGLSREVVVENQRARLLDAMVEVVAERGYGEATIAEAVRAARVSRKTFYELFVDKDACFAAACERWLGELTAATKASFEESPQAPWTARIRAAVRQFLRTLAEDPVAARTFVVEAAGAGQQAVTRRDATIREFAELIDLGRSSGALQPPGITSVMLVGGVEELVRSRIIHGAAAQLPDLLPDVVFCLAQPLLGTEAAAVERDQARAEL